MPNLELDIKQLADNGGTEPFAPLTVPEAVVFSDGDNLKDIIGTTDISNIGNGSITSAIGILNNEYKISIVSTSSVNVNTGHNNVIATFTNPFGENLKAVLICSTPNSAWVFGHVNSWSGNQINIGCYNTYTETLSGTFKLILLGKN